MRARSRLLLLALASAVSFVLALRGRALAEARGRVRSQEDVLAAVDRDLDRLGDLRARQDVVASAKRPSQDVIALVNSVLREAGVPTDRFKNLEPEGDVAEASGLRRQTLRLALEQITLPQLGSFLAKWRAEQALWNPTGIEITHRPAAAGAREDVFDARVVLAATYYAEPESPKERPR